MSVNPKQKNNRKKWISKTNQAARYSGIAFEMFFVILAGVIGGIKLDELLNSTPILTVVFSFIGVIAAIFFAIKDLLKKNGKT